MKNSPFCYASFDYSHESRLPVLTPEEAFEVDRFSIEQKKIESRLLMGWAGYASFLTLHRRKKFQKSCQVHILAGKGNNGGDGFALAYHILSSTTKSVRVWMNDNPQTANAHYFYDLCHLFVESQRFEVNPLPNIMSEDLKKTVVIDAIYGNGFKGNLDESIEEVFQFLNRQKKVFRVSLDIASGVYGNGDFFEHQPFSAELTLAFGSARIGHLLEPGIFFSGIVQVLPIGFYPSKDFILSRNILGEQIWRTHRVLKANKYISGELKVLGGSKGMEGAAIMAGYAFLKSGGGLVKIFSSSKAIQENLSKHPELMLHYQKNFENLEKDFLLALSKSKKQQYVLIGVGLLEIISEKFWQQLTQLTHVSVVLDASVLKQISPWANILKKRKFKQLVLTPHKGEAQALVQTKQNNMRELALEIVEQYAACVHLKGPGGILIENNFGQVHEIYINSKESQLAVGGSGDILSGMVASALVGDLDTMRAVATAIYFHKEASKMVLKKMNPSKKRSAKSKTALKDFFLPTDILNELPALIKEKE